MCDLGEIVGSECEGNILLLRNCVADISTHLKLVKQKTGSISEGQLIQVRAGIGEEDAGNKTVCAFHRYQLGTKFKPKRTCQHPLHANRPAKTNTTITDRTIGVQMVQEIKDAWGQHVYFGSGK